MAFQQTQNVIIGLKSMYSNKKVLFTLRTFKHLPYVYKLINQIALSYNCIIHVDERWDKDSLQRVRESGLLVPGIEIRPAIKLSIFQKILCELKEYYAYIYYEHRLGSMSFYTKRWRSYQKLFKPLNFLARHSFFRKILLSTRVRSIFSRLYSSRSLSVYMGTNDIGAVVCTSLNLRYTNEDFYLQTAKSCRIKTYYPILTWDNLSTKSTFMTMPETVFCFNSSQKRQLSKWHRINSSIQVCGSLFFEKWTALKETVHKKNKSSNKPYILYLGSSANVIGDESSIIYFLRLVLYRIKEKFNLEVELILKNHPAKINKIDKSLGVIVYEDFGLCESNDNELDYAQLLHNSLAVLGVNTSGLIDATFVNGNVFALTDAGKNTRQAGVLHFEEMCESFNIKKLSLTAVDLLESILVAVLSSERDRENTTEELAAIVPSQFMKDYICAEVG